jgi:inhibitor of the pro-sigma K processing machinery
MAEVILTLPLWGIGLIGIVLILLALGIVFWLKNFLANSVIGLGALLIINYLGVSYGINLPINILTIVITGILGLAGVGLLLVLNFLGIKIY